MPEPMDVKCPSCSQRLTAADESGLVNVLQEHLYDEHALERVMNFCIGTVVCPYADSKTLPDRCE